MGSTPSVALSHVQIGERRWDLLDFSMDLFRKFKDDPDPLSTIVNRALPTLQAAGFHVPKGYIPNSAETLENLEMIGFEILRDQADARGDSKAVTNNDLARYTKLRKVGGFQPYIPTIRHCQRSFCLLFNSEKVCGADDRINQPWRSVADPLLSCWCWVYGPVGLYWVIPIWLAMYANDVEWTIKRASNEVECVHSKQVNIALFQLQHQPEMDHLICPGLPKNCAVTVKRTPQSEWLQFYELHRFLMSYQCDSLDEDAPLCTMERLRMRSQNHLVELYPSEEEISKNELALFMVVSAGIVLASAVVDVTNDMWYIDLLCSTTRSGGGRSLMTHLQMEAPNGIQLTSSPGARQFYQAMGFLPPGGSNRRFILEWRRPKMDEPIIPKQRTASIATTEKKSQTTTSRAKLHPHFAPYHQRLPRIWRRA